MPFRELFDTLRLLTPYDVTGRKVRIGSANDGGYVMMDRFTPGQIIFSYGLSWNIAFEFDLANRGHQLFMFDHTIDRLTMEHRHFTWLKEGLSEATSSQDSLYSLTDHLARLAPNANGMILKLDVEGAEWSVFEKMPSETLLRFEQVVVEMHDLRRFVEPEWRSRAFVALRRLTEHFTIHHVHANNHGPLVVADNIFPVADVIEISLVRSDLVERSPLSVFLPTQLDGPNDPARPEIPLWFFPFVPMVRDATQAVLDERLGAAVTRFNASLKHSCV